MVYIVAMMVVGRCMNGRGDGIQQPIDGKDKGCKTNDTDNDSTWIIAPWNWWWMVVMSSVCIDDVHRCDGRSLVITACMRRCLEQTKETYTSDGARCAHCIHSSDTVTIVVWCAAWCGGEWQASGDTMVVRISMVRATNDNWRLSESVLALLRFMFSLWEWSHPKMRFEIINRSWRDFMSRIPNLQSES